jgi:hypothetical protein
MRYAHSHSPPLIHRDLKTPNILLRTDLINNPLPMDELLSEACPPLAAISDFGISTLLFGDTVQLMNAELVAPYWSPPEFISRKEISAKSDTYAFGIIMWEIVTRQLPFLEKFSDCAINIEEQVGAFIVKGGRPSIPPEMPPSFARLIQSCWEHNPKFRPDFHEITREILRISQEIIPESHWDISDFDDVACWVSPISSDSEERKDFSTIHESFVTIKSPQRLFSSHSVSLRLTQTNARLSIPFGDARLCHFCGMGVSTGRLRYFRKHSLCRICGVPHCPRCSSGSRLGGPSTCVLCFFESEEYLPTRNIRCAAMCDVNCEWLWMVLENGEVGLSHGPSIRLVDPSVEQSHSVDASVHYAYLSDLLDSPSIGEENSSNIYAARHIVFETRGNGDDYIWISSPSGYLQVWRPYPLSTDDLFSESLFGFSFEVRIGLSTIWKKMWVTIEEGLLSFFVDDRLSSANLILCLHTPRSHAESDFSDGGSDCTFSHIKNIRWDDTKTLVAVFGPCLSFGSSLSLTRTLPEPTPSISPNDVLSSVDNPPHMDSTVRFRGDADALQNLFRLIRRLFFSSLRFSNRALLTSFPPSSSAPSPPLTPRPSFSSPSRFLVPVASQYLAPRIVLTDTAAAVPNAFTSLLATKGGVLTASDDLIIREWYCENVADRTGFRFDLPQILQRRSVTIHSAEVTCPVSCMIAVDRDLIWVAFGADIATIDLQKGRRKHDCTEETRSVGVEEWLEYEWISKRYNCSNCSSQELQGEHCKRCGFFLCSSCAPACVGICENSSPHLFFPFTSSIGSSALPFTSSTPLSSETPSFPRSSKTLSIYSHFPSDELELLTPSKSLPLHHGPVIAMFVIRMANTSNQWRLTSSVREGIYPVEVITIDPEGSLLVWDIDTCQVLSVVHLGYRVRSFSSYGNEFWISVDRPSSGERKEGRIFRCRMSKDIEEDVPVFESKEEGKEEILQEHDVELSDKSLNEIENREEVLANGKLRIEKFPHPDGTGVCSISVTPKGVWVASRGEEKIFFLPTSHL